jgi:hypothetical protein
VSKVFGKTTTVWSNQYFFENADALLGRFVPDVCAVTLFYFGDASSSSLLILLILGLFRPPASVVPPAFFTYLVLFWCAFKFRLFDRL